MNLLKNIWAKIVIGLTAILGIVLYILNLKNKELNAYKAKIHLADTKEQVKDIEREIITKMEEVKDNKVEIAKLEKNLEQLENKKLQIAEKDGRDVEDYWNN